MISRSWFCLGPENPSEISSISRHATSLERAAWAEAWTSILIDHRDVAEAALRVLTDPARWGAHHDLTGPIPMPWPEALELLSAELGEPVTFRVARERDFLERLIGAEVPPGKAELLIAREWAILAGENDYTTDTFQQITGRPPRSVAKFLHEHRAAFL
jgi:NAD(P)H dehydrogenase (quinone)